MENLESKIDTLWMQARAVLCLKDQKRLHMYTGRMSAAERRYKANTHLGLSIRGVARLLILQAMLKGAEGELPADSDAQVLGFCVRETLSALWREAVRNLTRR